MSANKGQTNNIALHVVRSFCQASATQRSDCGLFSTNTSLYTLVSDASGRSIDHRPRLTFTNGHIKTILFPAIRPNNKAGVVVEGP